MSKCECPDGGHYPHCAYAPTASEIATSHAECDVVISKLQARADSYAKASKERDARRFKAESELAKLTDSFGEVSVMLSKSQAEVEKVEFREQVLAQGVSVEKQKAYLSRQRAEKAEATIKEVKKRLSTALVSNSAHDLRSAIQDAWEALVESEG